MPLKIGVCVKSVPSPDCYDKIEIDSAKKTLVRSATQAVINEADKHALELAFRIKEQLGAEITAVTMGPPEAREQLYEVLAMGADKAVLLSDENLAGADTLATSYTLSVLLQSLDSFDIILAGNESDDGATAHVPSQLGEWLNIPHIMDVISLEMEGEKQLLAGKELEDGIALYRLPLPCLVAVKKKINKLRYTTMSGLFAAKHKPLIVLKAADLPGLNQDYIGLQGSPTRAGELKTMGSSRNARAIQGTEEAIAAAILEKLGAITGKKGGIVDEA